MRYHQKQFLRIGRRWSEDNVDAKTSSLRSQEIDFADEFSSDPTFAIHSRWRKFLSLRWLIRGHLIGPLSGLIVAQRRIGARRAEVPADNTFNQRNVRLFRASGPRLVALRSPANREPASSYRRRDIVDITSALYLCPGNKSTSGMHRMIARRDNCVVIASQIERV